MYDFMNMCAHTTTFVLSAPYKKNAKTTVKNETNIESVLLDEPLAAGDGATGVVIAGYVASGAMSSPAEELFKE